MPKLPVIVYGSTGFTSADAGAGAGAVCACAFEVIVAMAASVAMQVAEWSFMFEGVPVLLNVRLDNALHVVCPKRKVEIVQAVGGKFGPLISEYQTRRAPIAGVESGVVHGSGATDPVEIRGGARRGSSSAP